MMMSLNTSADGMPLTFALFPAGNNIESPSAALSRRSPTFRSTDVEALKTAAAWAVNFVWKPTWTGARPAPASQQWARGHALAAKRAVFSHWKAVEPLCEKSSFFATMSEYYNACGRDYTERLPPTLIVKPLQGVAPDDWQGWREFVAARASLNARGDGSMWLAKPVDENRGIGIEVVWSEAEARNFLQSKGRAASIGVKCEWVLQKYMERPLLSPCRRKFDLRVWALVLDTGDCFLYAPGYVRTSSDVFDATDTSRFAHLTNYCQQVSSASFGVHEEGNTVRFETLETWIAHALERGASCGSATCGAEALWGCGEDGVWAQIRASFREMIDALRLRGGLRTGGFEENGISRKPPLGVVPGGDGGAPRPQTPGAPGSQHRFELLGLDFLIAHDLRVKFIEVNTNPSLDHQSKWHGAFVDTMVDRLLDIVIASTWPEIASSMAPLDESAPETTWTPSGDPAADEVAATFRPRHGWAHVLNAFTSPPSFPSQLPTASARRAPSVAHGQTKGGAPLTQKPPLSMPPRSPVRLVAASSSRPVYTSVSAPPSPGRWAEGGRAAAPVRGRTLQRVTQVEAVKVGRAPSAGAITSADTANVRRSRTVAVSSDRRSDAPSVRVSTVNVSFPT
jgi:hypothetical protein